MKKIILLIIILFGLSGYSQCWENISAGDDHILAVKSDGTLWAWGANNYSKCAPSFENSTNIPTQANSENNWLMPSAGRYHSMVTKNNNKVYGWGINWKGEIGIGTSGLQYNVVDNYVQVGNNSWLSVVAGNDFTIAIKTDGTLWNWGDNITVPTQVGLENNWQKIAIGNRNYAIKSDGTLWTWKPSAPSQIGNSTDWKEITGGYAIKENGTLWDVSSVPSQIGSETNWKSVSKNYYGNHQLALKNDGTLWAWGSNTYGQLGDGTTTGKINPIQIGSSTNWSFIAAGGAFSLALNDDGELWTWGANFFGQLGDGSFNPKSIPTLINCAALNVPDTRTRNAFNIYPNPSQKIINIDVDKIGEVNRIFIVNNVGQYCSELKKNTKEINIENLPNGIYFISIETEKGNYVSKFVKN